MVPVCFFVLSEQQNLGERAKDFNLILEDVSITDLQFGREFTAAVEAKQVGAWAAHSRTMALVCRAQDR